MRVEEFCFGQFRWLPEMNAPDRRQLEETYRDFSDEQVLRLAADLDSLTDARHVLDCELRRRRLGDADIRPYWEERREPTPWSQAPITAFRAKSTAPTNSTW